MTYALILFILLKLHVNNIDGISSEHLRFGSSPVLLSVLSGLFCAILSWQVLPSSSEAGIIVPVLKKPGLNPNDVASLRPIALSTTF